MRCWADSDDDEGASSCFEREVRASQATVDALSLSRDLSVFDFVPEYWNDVFEGVLLTGLRTGITPNQDLACNRSIKFGAFPQRLAAEAGAEEAPPFATGHYARLGARDDGSVRLLRAADDIKDQTYFLASVPGEGFRSAMFPIGGLLKTDVRQIAAHVGLPAAGDRSSRGICFVGKRGMADFTARYMAPERGASGRGPEFVLDGKVIAEAPKPAYCYTVGQRARVGGVSGRLFVKKCVDGDVVLQRFPPETCAVRCADAHWIGGEAPTGLGESGGGLVSMQYKGCSTGEIASCFLSRSEDGGICVGFGEPRAAIAPGQVVVFYNGEEVVGSAIVSECTIL